MVTHRPAFLQKLFCAICQVREESFLIHWSSKKKNRSRLSSIPKEGTVRFVLEMELNTERWAGQQHRQAQFSSIS